MNIYLDIDGVLLVDDSKLANFAPEFMEYVLTKYPDSTYWLTTHCQGDASVPMRRLGHMFEPRIAELMLAIKPTSFDHAKTTGIDFSKPFLWFDDDCYQRERRDLKKNNAFNSWVEVDLRNYPDQLMREIKLLESFVEDNGK
jgi:hypothetical protein